MNSKTVSIPLELATGIRSVLADYEYRLLTEAHVLELEGKMTLAKSKYEDIERVRSQRALLGQALRGKEDKS